MKNKPEWLLKAEEEQAKFKESKFGKMSDTNIARSISGVISRNKYKEENPEEFKQGIQNAVDASIEWRKANPEKSTQISSDGGKSAMSGEHANKIHSMGGKVSGPNSAPKMHAKNLESGHYDTLHSGETLEKAHNTRKTNGGYKKFSDGGNKAKTAKHLRIYHERVSKILPILPNDWFTRKEAENIYEASEVRKEIQAPGGVIKRILTELEFVESNEKTRNARRYKKI